LLNTPAAFPAAGSAAFLRCTGEQVRIQRRNADGTLLISRPDSLPRAASGNTTVTHSDLFATAAEAIDAGLAKPRRKGARK
jgi:hypothetical protein